MNLWDNSVAYSIGRLYIDACIRSNFSRIKVYGRENIPSEGAVLFAINHTNTLMDALVMLQDNKGPLAFGARADIFRKPKIAAILDWLKIVPLARQRDGANAVAGNSATFSRIVECIGHNTPFCIYPEGTHTTRHSLQPIKKGVFRIAIQAVKELEGKKVYVVPVGVDYEDFFHCNTALTIKYGEPMDIAEILSIHTDENEATHYMTEELFRRISSLIRYVPDGPDYESEWIEYVRTHQGKKCPDWIRWTAAVLLLPVFAVSAVLAAPITIPSFFIIRKLKDKAWSNTVRFACKLVILPLLTILAAALGFSLLPWQWALPLTVATVFSAPVFYRILNQYIKLLK